MAATRPWRCGVKKSKQLPDKFYDDQIERLSGLPKFPVLPLAQREFRRALRRISDSDGEFIHKLINDVIDSATTCPTPAALLNLAGAKRHRVRGSLGKADCGQCQGTGFVTKTRMVELPGMVPYEAEYAAVCPCRGGKHDALAG